MTNMSFRTLSLDAGGTQGSFTAGVLAGTEKDTGQRCVDHFDLIAGTSTSGINSLALRLGLSSAAIVKSWMNHGPTIFPSTSLARRWSGVLRHLIHPRHLNESLRAALTKVFGKRKFGESQRRMIKVCARSIAC